MESSEFGSLSSQGKTGNFVVTWRIFFDNLLMQATPVLTWLGGTPSQDGGTLSWGTPRPDLAEGYPPGRAMGPVEVLWDGDGVPARVWTDKQAETITFPHPSDAGGNNIVLNMCVRVSQGCVC